jgi:hypothetical protein
VHVGPDSGSKFIAIPPSSQISEDAGSKQMNQPIFAETPSCPSAHIVMSMFSGATCN